MTHTGAHRPLLVRTPGLGRNAAVDDFPAELRGDDDAIADRGDRRADEDLVVIRTIHFRRVDERDALFDGGE